MDLCRSFWRPLAILRFCPQQNSKNMGCEHGRSAPQKCVSRAQKSVSGCNGAYLGSVQDRILRTWDVNLVDRHPKLRPASKKKVFLDAMENIWDARWKAQWWINMEMWKISVKYRCIPPIFFVTKELGREQSRIPGGGGGDPRNGHGRRDYYFFRAAAAMAVETTTFRGRPQPEGHPHHGVVWYRGKWVLNRKKNENQRNGCGRPRRRRRPEIKKAGLFRSAPQAPQKYHRTRETYVGTHFVWYFGAGKFQENVRQDQEHKGGPDRIQINTVAGRTL
eukprot:gene25795-biopygen7517